MEPPASTAATNGGELALQVKDEGGALQIPGEGPGGAEAQTELQRAGAEAGPRRSGSDGVVGGLIARYGPVVREVAEKSRAGEGSGHVITFAIVVLAVMMLAVLALVMAEPAPVGPPPPPPIRAFNAGDDLDGDGVIEYPECNADTLQPLIDDLELQQKRRAPDGTPYWGDEMRQQWSQALDHAQTLQGELQALEIYPEVDPEPEPEQEEKSLWYVGVLMSCCACLANSFGYNFVRYAHSKVDHRVAMGDDSAKVMQYWQFPVGWFCSIVLCAGLDTIALSFTDPALIAPLAGLTLVLNVWVAQLINKEKVFPLDGAVTALIISGVIVTIMSGPSAAFPVVDADYLWTQVFRSDFLFYEFLMYGSAIIVQKWCRQVYGDKTEAGIAAGRAANPKLNQFSPLLFPWVGAIFTAHMNLTIKAFLSYLQGPCGDSEWGVMACFSELGPYFIIVWLLVSCYIQLNAINDGLRTEGALIFVPIKSALNVAQVSLACTTFYQTLDTMDTLQTWRYVVGLLTVIIGITLITLRPVVEEEEPGARVSGGGGLQEGLTPRPPEGGEAAPVEQTTNQLHDDETI